MVEMLKLRKHLIIITKVKAQANIDGNEQADKLAKAGIAFFHSLPTQPYENAHSNPYYVHKDSWPSMANTPYKGPRKAST
jgi:hypothetical protein